MKKLRIGVVGPCAAGKTTLVAALKNRGYEVHHIAQEHSYVPYMWKRITNPDVLIYLHVSYSLTLERRRIDWTESEYRVQLDRLENARQAADLFIDTDYLTPEEVLATVIDFLNPIE